MNKLDKTALRQVFVKGEYSTADRQTDTETHKTRLRYVKTTLAKK